MTANSNDALLGNVLDGRYEILARVARGGMATVYRAWDRRLERIVAVKVMHDGLGDDADFAAKFDREARAAAKLINPNVIGVYDQGQDQGRPYIVMEFIDGHTLRKTIVTEAPVSALRALQIMEPIAAALAAAHEAGIVHRDVKPENVLISDRGDQPGAVKVGDFGLARSVTSHSATATQGLLIGTVSYLPPELVVIGRADSRSDVYSAGIIFYELLTGKKPHSGDTPIQVAYAHVNNDIEPPSARLAKEHPQLARRQPIPDYVDALVLACTRRDEKLRPRDGHALLSRIRRARRALEQGVENDEALVAIMFPDAPEGSMTTRNLALEPAATPQVGPPKPAQPLPKLAAAISRGSSAIAKPFAKAARPAPVAPAATVIDEPTDPDLEPTPTDQVALAPSQDEVNVRYGWQEKRKPRRRPNWIVALILAVLLAIGGWWLFAGRFTSTPAFAGMTQAEATTWANKAELKITFAEAYSEDVQAGRIVSTKPGAGEKIPRGGTVSAIVSKGAERYPMPDVFGKPLDQAKAAIEKNHLKVGQVKEAFHPTGAKGTVIETSVGAGEMVAPATPVDLTISKGKEPLEVPKVVGQQVSEATKRLGDIGLKVTITETPAREPAGRVIAQQPDSGQIFAGDSVQLTVSTGPKKVTVPSVGGQKIADATSAIEGAGFKVRVEYSTELRHRLGIAVSTTPEGGTEADEGSEVVIKAV